MSPNSISSDTPIDTPNRAEIVTLIGTVTTIGDSFGLILGDDGKTYVYPFSEFKRDSDGNFTTRKIPYSPERNDRVYFNLERRALNKTGLPEEEQEAFRDEWPEAVRLCWWVKQLTEDTHKTIEDVLSLV